MFDSLSEQLRDRFKSIERKTVIIGAAVGAGVVALASGGIYYAPYLTIDNLKNATANRNTDALSESIDFPALRMSIKENVKIQVLKQMAGAEAPTSTKMTPAQVEKTIDPLVDKLVTPEGIERLMHDKIPEAKIDLSNLDRDMNKSDLTMGYESFDRFVVRITDKVDRSKNVSLILKRSGLGWKLAGIDIAKFS
ncbi:DUF2939 domain-containing protein [Chamaesiphon minutus]|uniref:DUF2939 domain-containing protein n=1 Tax=Chamaesiphon minutus (strain ATCC 27169 / PCC 6605) TaxID=1173020 RepID=K9UDJ0_CHAP6|nr:DUF2939 domain-containing protein [Chamaesiphon minutus]AFY92491.1 Protein of unknown function (DUF2939) [Chamaesiphon minutus PCC 6605]